MNRLFAYGTLKNPNVQKEVLERVIDGKEDTLEGFKKSKIRIKEIEYPILIPDKTSKVEGHVLQITDDELEKIDKYETSAYRRIKVKLQSGEDAWAYVK